jgi:CHAT domain-containing protein/tetratricopeptide (TPR) repeat protein
VRRSNEHLSSDEIDIAVEGFANLKDSAAEAHLEGCVECFQKVEAQKLDQGRLVSLLRSTAQAGRGQCPTPEMWLNLTTGRTDSEEASALMSHAAQCDRCGLIISEMTGGTDTEESITWPTQKALEIARKMANESSAKILEQPDVIATPLRERRQRVVGWWRGWIVAATVAASLAGATILILHQGWFYSRPPFEQLAKAFSLQPTSELRFPGADFGGEVKRNRGAAEGSRLDSPRVLLQAEAEIARGIELHPSDPAWLEAKARADFLRNNLDAARESLQKALEIAPNSASLEQDLAMVWFEAAEVSRDASDYTRAIELLSVVLRANPNDAVARFNRALALEKMFLYQQSLEDWQLYLQQDPKSAWANEARKHIDRLRKKLNSSTKQPDATRIEPGDPAVMELLHANYRSSDGMPRADPSRVKLAELAKTFERQYEDHWLSSLIAERRSRAFAEAVEILYEAFNQNEGGNAERGEILARQALLRFQKLDSAAGKLRAQYEIANGLRLRLHARECLEVSQLLERGAEKNLFSWLEVQAKLQTADAWFMLNDLDSASQGFQSAITESERHRLWTLNLRARGFEASSHSANGRCREAANSAHNALGAFWSSEFPPYRAYEFYAGLGYCAERNNQPELAIAVTRESVSTLVRTSDRRTEALERYKLARLVAAAGNLSEAKREFVKSRTLFDSVPRSTLTDLYRISALIGAAQSAVRLGNVSAALDILQPMERQIHMVGNQGIVAVYYSALGEAQLKSGDFVSSARSLEAFLRYGEEGLRVMKTDLDREGLATEMDMAYRSMVRVALERNEPVRALALWEWYKAAGIRTGESPGIIRRGRSEWTAEIESLPERMQATIRSFGSSTVLSYVQMEDGIAAWSLDGREIQYRWLPIPRKEMDSTARRFAETCSNSNSTLPEISKLGTQLYEKLVAPFGSNLPRDKTLLLELDGPISLVPFAALQNPSGDYFGDNHVLVTSPGILYAEHKGIQVPDVIGEPPRLVAVGNPRLDPAAARRYGPLPDAQEEAELAASVSSPSTLLIDERATPSAVRRELMSAAIFHFAGHAVATPERSGLLLASSGSQDTTKGFWSADDLPPHSLSHCRLVVLSACSTGEVDRASLNSPDNLVHKFLTAGAGELIASRWVVDSHATHDLMARLYDELRQGSSPASALQSASIALRRSGRNHPRYWAAFAVFGARDSITTMFAQQVEARRRLRIQ